MAGGVINHMSDDGRWGHQSRHQSGLWEAVLEAHFGTGLGTVPRAKNGTCLTNEREARLTPSSAPACASIVVDLVLARYVLDCSHQHLQLLM